MQAWSPARLPTNGRRMAAKGGRAIFVNMIMSALSSIGQCLTLRLISHRDVRKLRSPLSRRRVTGVSLTIKQRKQNEIPSAFSWRVAMPPAIDRRAAAALLILRFFLAIFLLQWSVEK